MSPTQIQEANRYFIRYQMRKFEELLAENPKPVSEVLSQIISELDATRVQLDTWVDVRLALKSLNRARKLAGLQPLELPHRDTTPSPMAAQQQAAEGQAQWLGVVPQPTRTPPSPTGQFLEVICTSEADHEVDFRFEVSTPAGVQLTRREVKDAIKALIDSKTPPS